MYAATWNRVDVSVTIMPAYQAVVSPANHYPRGHRIRAIAGCLEGMRRYLRGRRWLGSIVRATMSYFENCNSLQHYDGGINPISYTLGEALGTTDDQNKRNQYENCPPLRCQCLGPNDIVCEQVVTCYSAPEHFRAVHGIKDAARNVPIHCRWVDCNQQVLRHNFLRHVRETHLKHNRNNGHSAS